MDMLYLFGSAVIFVFGATLAFVTRVERDIDRILPTDPAED